MDDRCPHMGFPLHRGTVENGLLTCHWHHARFDLASGGTLDPFADDVRAHGVEVDGADVFVVLRAADDPAGHHLRRLAEGLEQGLTLVLAKAVLGLMELLGPEQGALAAVREGADFGLVEPRGRLGRRADGADSDGERAAGVGTAGPAPRPRARAALCFPQHPRPPSPLCAPSAAGGDPARPPGVLVPALHRHPQRRRGGTSPCYGDRCRAVTGGARSR